MSEQQVFAAVRLSQTHTSKRNDSFVCLLQILINDLLPMLHTIPPHGPHEVVAVQLQSISTKQLSHLQSFSSVLFQQHPVEVKHKKLMDPNYPFTAAQWQELELQTLFFNYMMSGHPIPPDLILSINKPRSCKSQPQHIGIGIGIGWSSFDMGRKPDPEPTRCRRTDGKKWRCSRQTTGESKYCERHMHRGKSHPTRKLQTPQLLSQSQNVKDSNFMMTSLDIDHKKSSSEQKQKVLCSDDDVMKRNENRQRMVKMYHQFIDESPSPTRQKRDSWLSLVI